MFHIQLFMGGAVLGIELPVLGSMRAP